MMASGKSAVGAALAERLGWDLVDLDREVEAIAGRPVREIFARDGEAAFRALEAEATARIAGRERVVLAPGGGWITNPELLDALGPGTLSVWLRVTAEEAAARAAGQPGERPLLAGADPAAALRTLLSRREPLYARAALHLDTGGRTVAQVAGDIEIELRARTGRAADLP